MEWLGADSPFLFRDVELAELIRAIHESGGGRTLLALIGGESGVGKSRLVNEAAHLVRDRAQVLSGSAIDIAEKRPYWPIIDALRHLLADGDATWAISAVQPWRIQLSVLLCFSIPPDVDGRPYGIEVSSDIASPPAELPEVELLCQVLTALASRHPIVFAIEDLQWADHSTRDFLAYALANLFEVPLIFIATYRSDAMTKAHPLRRLLPELQRNRRVRSMNLSPIDEAATSAFIAATSELPEVTKAIEDLVWMRSEGNFFLAEETLRALRSGSSNEIPITLRQMVLGRIDSFAQPIHDVLHSIAAADEPVTHELLVAVTDLGEAELNAAIRQAVDASVLVVDRDRSVYRYRHALYKEVIASELLPGEQQRLHRRFAQALDVASNPTDTRIAARLAHHWDRAREWSRALAATAEAAEHALAAHGYSEAHSHWMRSLQLIERIEPRTSPFDRELLLEQAAESATLAGEHLQAVALIQERINTLGHNDREGARVHQHLGRYMAAAGNSRAALEAHARAVDLLPDDAEAAVRASVLNGFAQALMTSGQYAKAQIQAERAATLAEEIGASTEQARALATLGFSLAHLEDPAAGTAVLEQSLRLTEELGNVVDIGRVLVSLSELYAGPLNRLADAVSMARESADRVRALGLERTIGVELHAIAANALFRLGRWVEAGAELTLALDAKPTGAQAIDLRLARARLLVGWGDVGAAQDELEALDVLLAESIRPHDRIPLLTLRAGLALWQGQSDVACEAVLAALDIVNLDSEDAWLIAPLIWHGLRAIGDEAEEARFARADTHRSGGSRTATNKSEVVFVERMRALAERVSVAPDVAAGTVVGYLQLAEGEISRSRNESDPEIWSRAANTWQALGHPYPTAYAWYRYADASFAIRARAADAATALRLAHITARALGARPLVALIVSLATRARVNLDSESTVASSADQRSAREDQEPLIAARTGVKPVSDAARLADLTEREIMVLEQLAEGLTNREIARHLFISEKTVSAHVSHILSKLGVHSRVQASAHFYRATADLP